MKGTIESTETFLNVAVADMTMAIVTRCVIVYLYKQYWNTLRILNWNSWFDSLNKQWIISINNKNENNEKQNDSNRMCKDYDLILFLFTDTVVRIEFILNVYLMLLIVWTILDDIYQLNVTSLFLNFFFFVSKCGIIRNI